MAFNDRTHLQDEVRDLESRARTVRTFQPSVVPGLLQTADYARRVFSLFEVPYTEENTAAAVAGRLHRQLALYEEGKQFEFLITEAALRWRPGPPKLLLAQLDRISSLSTLDSVSVGLIPQNGEAIAVTSHGFIIYDNERDNGDTFVEVETIHASLIVNSPGDVNLYEKKWSLLRQMAIVDQEALTFLAALRAELSGPAA